MYNVAEFMNDRVAVVEVERFQAYMESDPVVGRLMDVAETVEDMYEVAKRYIQIQIDDFRQIFNETMDYFKVSKAELDDDTMECVVGGFSWGGFWNGLKKVVVATAIVAAVVVAGVTTCGLAAGAIGAVGAAVAGTSIATGFAAGAVTGAIGGWALVGTNLVKGMTNA